VSAVGTFFHHIISTASGPVVYLLVFLVPALEASLFVGFVLPGETAVIVGGVLASRHHVSLTGILGAAIAGAVVGDSVGYVVGRRYGQALQQSRLGRTVGQKRWRASDDFLRRRGGPSVFLGRWTALLRALIPAAAGMAKLPYRTFFVWNVAGGILWAATMVIAGYLAGNAYTKVEQYLGRGALVVLALIIVGLVVRHLRAARSGAA
jgi:membrane protein DedA with SNARE-associated domain